MYLGLGIRSRVVRLFVLEMGYGFLLLLNSNSYYMVLSQSRIVFRDRRKIRHFLKAGNRKMIIEIDTKHYITNLRHWLLRSKLRHHRQKLPSHPKMEPSFQYVCRMSQA